MFEKQQLERILASQGLSPDTPDDEIRTLLMKIEWHKDDIDAALYVLRENNDTKKTHVDSLHHVFRTDERLRPETIKSLLGIDVDIQSMDIAPGVRKKVLKYSLGQVINIVVVSLIIASLMLILGMWFMKLGMFHVAV